MGLQVSGVKFSGIKSHHRGLELVQVLHGSAFGSATLFTIPNYVDNTYLGIFVDYVATAYSAGGAPGWTTVTPVTNAGGDAMAYTWKILAVGDRGLNYTGGIYPTGVTNHRAQFYIFKTLNNSVITSVTSGNTFSVTNEVSIGTTTVNGTTVPSISGAQSAIVLHHFYDQANALAPITSTPAMSLMRNTTNDYQGTQYAIYNPSTTMPASQQVTHQRLLVATASLDVITWFVASY